MVERIVVDHTTYNCRKCGHDYTLDVTVPVLCPTCTPASPYYLAEEWALGAALVLYRKRSTDENPVRVCIFTDGGATLSPATKQYAETIIELLTAIEME